MRLYALHRVRYLISKPNYHTHHLAQSCCRESWGLGLSCRRQVYFDAWTYHERSLLSAQLASLVRLLADEVDALYLSLDGALDVCVEGAGKVHSSTLPSMKREGSSM